MASLWVTTARPNNHQASAGVDLKEASAMNEARRNPRYLKQRSGAAIPRGSLALYFPAAILLFSVMLPAHLAFAQARTSPSAKPLSVPDLSGVWTPGPGSGNGGNIFRK